jgi:hypothetical protein
VIFSFAKISNYSLTATRIDDETNGTEIGLYQRVIEMKSKNTDLKVLLAVGGKYLNFARYILYFYHQLFH